MLEGELADEAEWITECMARLFIHSRLFQCSRFYGDGLSALDKCPGIKRNNWAQTLHYNNIREANLV